MSLHPARTEKVSTAAASEAATIGDELAPVLEAISENEALFSERFYEIFFAIRPDARALFGAYPIAEQEEMMRETLRSLHAWLEAEPWLDLNLVALGRSHAEYGVTSDMYAPFVDAMLECSREQFGERLGERGENALRSALVEIAHAMRDAGEAGGSTLPS